MPTETPHALADSPEYALVGAILRQAVVDLRDTAPPWEQAWSVALFTNADHHLELLCSLVDLDHEGVQQAVMRQYPQWFASQGRREGARRPSMTKATQRHTLSTEAAAPLSRSHPRRSVWPMTPCSLIPPPPDTDTAPLKALNEHHHNSVRTL